MQKWNVLSKKWNVLSWTLSIGLGMSLLGCSSPPSMSTTTAIASADSLTTDTTQSTRVQPSHKSSNTDVLAQHLPITAQATVNDTVIELEVAMTPAQQAIGLMHRSSLADNHGMLFPFEPPRPVHFWMRNVKINLDMIFIRDNQVMAIASQVPPCRTATCPTYGPSGVAVDYVLELNGGRAEELELEVGDRITLTFLNTMSEEDIDS